MFTLALLAATAAAQPQQQASSKPLFRQATASIRVISGARITANEMPPEALVKTTEVKNSDGVKSVVRLIEFQ